ncbi:hypothetical protein ACB092_02G034800 [Castanea dentata]
MTEEEEEPILKEQNQRFCMFPIKYKQLWETYKKAQASFWTDKELLCPLALREKQSFYHLELLAIMSGCKSMLSDMHRNRELKNQDSGLETRCSTSRLRYSPPHLVFFCFGVVDTLEKCSAAKHHFPLLNIAITLLVGKDCTLLCQCVTRYY